MGDAAAGSGVADGCVIKGGSGEYGLNEISIASSDGNANCISPFMKRSSHPMFFRQPLLKVAGPTFNPNLSNSTSQQFGHQVFKKDSFVA